MKILLSRFILLVAILVIPEAVLRSQVISSNENIYFYHTDALGTPQAMTDESGKIVWKADYRPFGEIKDIINEIDNNRKFIGKEKDVETGLLYFGVRYYETKIGRFYSTEPVRPVNRNSSELNAIFIKNPQRLNLYSYSLNNPNKYVDPDGQFAFLIGAFTSVALDISLQVAINYYTGYSLTNINYKSLAFSAATGAVGAGLVNKFSKINKIRKAHKFISKISDTSANLGDDAARVIPNIADDAVGVLGKGFTREQLKHFEKQLAEGGVKAIEKSRRTISKNLLKHLKDYSKYKQAGGYTSKVKTEIKNFSREINAINEILKKSK